jgi:putative hydrolase of the HAD superfamily
MVTVPIWGMEETLSSIKAVSFDLWDTLVVDDSDEAVRRERGLRSKRDERRYLTWEALSAREPIPLEQVTLAFDTLDAAFNKVWHDQFVTWSIEERFEVLLRGLGRELPPAEFDALIAKQSDMEAEIPPRAIDGARDALEELAGRYRLCIVSDAVFTPGRSLRKILDAHDLESYFEVFVFSDEAGRSKPHRVAFDKAAEGLGVELSEMVHVGDRQHNDVAGPQALGMKAVLFVASRSADRENNSADAVCERHADLPAIIDGLAEAS